jgi:outer membrane lipoprotein
MRRQFFFMILLFPFLSACAAAISEQAMRDIDPNITFRALIMDPDNYRGKSILVGGQILSTAVKEKETWMEVLQQPLDWQKKPKGGDISEGRFLVHFDGFLDPAVYAAGRKITIVGKVEGKKAQPLKEMEYVYPVLKPQEHHLWTIEEYGGPSFHFGIGIGGTIH